MTCAYFLAKILKFDYTFLIRCLKDPQNMQPLVWKSSWDATPMNVRSFLPFLVHMKSYLMHIRLFCLQPIGTIQVFCNILYLINYLLLYQTWNRNYQLVIQPFLFFRHSKDMLF